MNKLNVKKVITMIICGAVYISLVLCTGCSTKQGKEVQNNEKIETPEIVNVISNNQANKSDLSEKKILYASNYIIFNMLNILTDGLNEKYEVKMIEASENKVCSMTSELKAELTKADTIVFMNCKQEQWLADSINKGEIVGVRVVDIGSLISERDRITEEMRLEEVGEVTVGEYGLIEADASEKIIDPQNIDYIIDILSIIISASDSSIQNKMTANKDAFIKEIEPYEGKVLTFEGLANNCLIVVDKQKLRYAAAKYGFDVIGFDEIENEAYEDNIINVCYFTDEEYETIKNIKNIKPVKLYDMINCSETDIKDRIRIIDMIKSNVENIDSEIISRGLDVIKVTD